MAAPSRTGTQVVEIELGGHGKTGHHPIERVFPHLG
jgi:hypothetical protein